MVISSVFLTISGSVWDERNTIGMSWIFQDFLGCLRPVDAGPEVDVHEDQIDGSGILVYDVDSRFAGRRMDHFVPGLLELSSLGEGDKRFILDKEDGLG